MTEEDKVEAKNKGEGSSNDAMNEILTVVTRATTLTTRISLSFGFATIQSVEN